MEQNERAKKVLQYVTGTIMIVTATLILSLHQALAAPSPQLLVDNTSMNRGTVPCIEGPGAPRMLSDLPLIGDLFAIHSKGSQASSPLPRRGALGIELSGLAAEEAKKYSLEAGQGATVGKVLPDLTGESVGLKAGDWILKMNGQPFVIQNMAKTMRSVVAGQTIVFDVIRAGKAVRIEGTVKEKPRDPGNENYTVEYSHVVSNGLKMRTIITKPRKPGKYPVLYHIQGFSPPSYDYVIEGPPGLSRINCRLLSKFANNGYITYRVEKPGVGDSEGGPFEEVDYTTELDIYRQGLKELKSLDGIDPKNIFIFGHSMGGAFGPMIASESPVRGVATYGTAAQTWFEYVLDINRDQSALAGAPLEAIDDSLRVTARAMNLALNEGMSPADIKMSKPDLAPAIDSIFPNGRLMDKTLDFWRQINNINFPKVWSSLDAHVLSVRGASDFVTYSKCHKIIADVVNKKNPGFGKFVELPNADHLMNNWATEAESHRNWPNGTWGDGFTDLLFDWTKEVMAKPAK